MVRRLRGWPPARPAFVLEPENRYVAAIFPGGTPALEAKPNDAFSLYANGLGPIARPYPDGQLLTRSYAMFRQFRSPDKTLPVYQLDIVVPEELGLAPSPDGAYLAIAR